MQNTKNANHVLHTHIRARIHSHAYVIQRDFPKSSWCITREKAYPT